MAVQPQATAMPSSFTSIASMLSDVVGGRRNNKMSAMSSRVCELEAPAKSSFIPSAAPQTAHQQPNQLQNLVATGPFLLDPLTLARKSPATFAAQTRGGLVVLKLVLIELAS